MKRRLSAILAADMVGYSRLMEADEVGTIERQKAHRAELIDPSFEQFHGRIVKVAGDGLLVEFSSVVDAVQCAVVIQQAMAVREAGVADDQCIQYRIGINLGDVVIEDDDLYGDGVNIAARLEQLAEAGGICISGTAYDHMRSIVDVGYESLGEIQVKNIERPIRVYKVLTGSKQAGALVDDRQSPVSGRFWKPVAAAAVLFVALIAIGTWWWSQQPDFEPADPTKYVFKLPEKPSIAVLPFDNLSGDPRHDYIGDSLSENIIAELATSPELLVIARNSVFAFKGKQVAVQDVAESLGVRYVLEGSIQREGDRLRIVAQLVDAIDGKHLWAERYDYKFTDIFTVQDDITAKLLEEMQVKLTVGEQVRRWRSVAQDPEIYRKMIEGRAAFQTWTPEGHKKVERLWRDVYRAHPETELSNHMMGWVYWHKVALGLAPDRMEALATARRYAEKARTASEGKLHSDTHLLLAALDITAERYATANEHIDVALRQSPSASDPHSLGSWARVVSGRTKDAITLAELAMRLEPSYPLFVARFLSLALIAEGRLSDARSVVTGILEHKDEVAEKRDALVDLIVISILEGEQRTAERLVAKLRKTMAEASVATVSRPLSVFKDKKFVRRYRTALRTAGLPEHPPPKLPD